MRALAGDLVEVSLVRTAAATHSTAGSVQITEYSLPDRIDPEQSFDVTARIENVGGESANVDVGDYFDNANIENAREERSGGEKGDVLVASGGGGTLLITIRHIDHSPKFADEIRELL